jgi:tetratricopeptide (TPR) repeat protein
MISYNKCVPGEIVSKLRFWYALIAILLFIAAFFWQLPAILKAMPSRYVARLPEPVQQLGVRGDQVPLLPTVVAPVNAAALLQGPSVPTAAPTTAAIPPTLTPPVAAFDLVETTTPFPTPTITPTIISTNTPVSIPSSVRLERIRHQFQTWNNCGPATIAMAISYFALYLDQKQTAAVLKPNPEDRNVSPHEMGAYVNNETPYAAVNRTNGTLETVKQLIASGFPVIIELGIEPPGEYRWLGWYGHYLLIVAYDDAGQQFWVYDSWFGTSETPMENADVDGRILAYTDADRQWRQFNRNYITLFRSEQADEVAAIIGEDVDDATMWQNSLTRVRAELAQEPEDAFLWFNLGTVYNALGQYENAATAFDQARAIGLPWRMLWYQFGPYEAYYQTGRYEEVILLADVTLKDRPYFEESFYYKGLAQAALGQLDAARKNFANAVDFNPNFKPAVAALNQSNN